MGDLWIGVLANIISTVILLVLSQARPRLSFMLAGYDPRVLSRSFLMLPLIWASLNIGFIYYVLHYNRSFPLLISVFFVSTVVILFLLWRELHKFWSLGIRGADQEIRRGIDYDKSLSLCKNQFAMLGIGAAKLTRQKEFEAAVRRCRPDQPIRLLLCKPTDENLTAAAIRFGKSRDEYQREVIGSLRRIAELKEQKGLNIEVRFHSLNPSIFRLLLIDDSICLLSYYILGEGDGSQLPQLHIVAPPQTVRVVNSFYYPFKLYFDNLWKASEKESWDYKAYL